MRSILVLTALAAATWAEGVSYEGYKVFRVHVRNENQLRTLASLNENDGLDFWSSLRLGAENIDVMVKPDALDNFVRFLNVHSLDHEILIGNVEEVVQKERISLIASSRRPRQRGISFEEYHRHHIINDYLERLAIEYPNMVQIETARSYEGRDLKTIKLSTDPQANKPILFIDAGIHAREWIAPSTALFVIDRLLNNTSFLEKVDWHIMPVVNPDGYEYTFTHDRLWRKTRTPGKYCDGTDANRNFDFHWSEVGASTNECAQDYCGPAPFSEPESRAIKDHILKFKDRIKLYVTLHSYGPYLLYPWGYTTELPENHEEMRKLGDEAAAKIKQVHGMTYTVGPAASTLYKVSGGSRDWAKGVAGVDVIYTIELPPGGSSGFDPPPRAIYGTVTETWEGIKAFHKYVDEQFG